MYGLDINFLKDREVRVFEAKPRARGGGVAGWPRAIAGRWF